MMNVLEALGLMTFSFIMGVRTDISMLKSAGKLPWIIGILSFLLPMSVVFPAAALFKKYFAEMDGFYLYWVGVMAAKTSFQVTSFLLEDLNLLNSKLGRLALSSSLISSIGSWIFDTYNAYYFKTEISRAISMIGIIFVLRPFMFWLMRKIPEGRPIKESHFFVITVMFFMVSFTDEYLGFSAPLGAMILGLCVPPGRPLGSGVVEKLEAFISAVLLPTYIVGAGRYVDIFQISMVHYIQAEILVLLCFSGKLAAGVIPSVICRMPYKDSFALGLLLSAQGFFDVIFFKLFHRYGVMLNHIYLFMFAIVRYVAFMPV